MKDIRRTLGVTQEEMAALLQISKSAWSMYENGYRELPTHALLKLSQMVIALEAPQYAEPPSLAASPQNQVFPKTIKKLKQDKRQAETALQKTTQTLQKLQALFASQQKMLAIMTSLKPDMSAKTFTPASLSLQQMVCMEKMDYASRDKQLLLEYKIKLLEAQQHITAEMLAAIDNGLL